MSSPDFTIRRFIHVYRLQMRHNPRRERLFLATLAFLLTFGFIRGLTYSIRYNLGPFHNVSVGGTHVHHLVWGILLLLVVGYVALVEFGTRGPVSNLVTRIGAIAFGIGAALTLDEFALWLNLQDVYWDRQGRESIDAVVIFGAILLVGLFGKDLIRALSWELRAMLKGVAWAERAAYLEYESIRRGHDASSHGAEGAEETIDGPT